MSQLVAPYSTGVESVSAEKPGAANLAFMKAMIPQAWIRPVPTARHDRRTIRVASAETLWMNTCPLIIVCVLMRPRVSRVSKRARVTAFGCSSKDVMACLGLLMIPVSSLICSPLISTPRAAKASSSVLLLTSVINQLPPSIFWRVIRRSPSKISTLSFMASADTSVPARPARSDWSLIVLAESSRCRSAMAFRTRLSTGSGSTLGSSLTVVYAGGAPRGDLLSTSKIECKAFSRTFSRPSLGTER